MVPASSGAGYSGTPLGKTLPLERGLRVQSDAMPDSLLADIDMPDTIYARPTFAIRRVRTRKSCR